jgi:3-oxoadipate enol-lactonase
MSTVHAVHGVELSISDLGAGDPPLVWGHGLTSSRAEEDELPLVDCAALATARRVVRYDARGHGASELTPSGYGWDELARDQLALADALGIDRFVAAGASMGAATALHAASIAPDRVVALVLVIPPTAWETRAAQGELYGQMAEVVEAHGVEPLIAGMELLDPPDPLIGNSGYRRRRARAMRAAGPERLATVLRGAAGTDLPPRQVIAAIGVPTLVLAWTGDPGHPESTATDLGALIPGAQISLASTAEELAGWTDQAATFLSEL